MAEVVVVGGGIAGIQAALDIAQHGVRVHLVEKEPTIGGHMAMLDMTFPTNDCSMFILSQGWSRWCGTPDAPLCLPGRCRVQGSDV